MDPISQIYLNVINEATLPDQKVHTNLKIGAAFGDSSNEKNATTFQKGTGCDNVEGLDTPEEASDELTSDIDSSLKKVKAESKNPFDLLYNRIISEEESFNFSTKKDNELESDSMSDSDFDFENNEDSSDEDSDVSEFADGEDSEGHEEITLTLNKELATELIELLQAAIGDDSGEDSYDDSGEDSEEDFGDDTEDGTGELAFGQSDDDTRKESFALDDAEELGEPLVDVEKLNCGLTDPSNHVVKGNIKAHKKHSEVPQTGKNSDGKLKPHNTKAGISKLTKKNQKVEGGVREGDFFNNK
jgi:hypothetical protein